MRRDGYGEPETELACARMIIAEALLDFFMANKHREARSAFLTLWTAAQADWSRRMQAEEDAVFGPFAPPTITSDCDAIDDGIPF
jgi:hypothetical protein